MSTSAFDLRSEISPDDTRKLGAFVDEFRVSFGALVMHGVAIVLAFGLGGLGVYKNLPLLAGGLGGLNLLVFLGALGAVVGTTVYGAVIVGRYWRGRHLRVLIHEEGFVCVRDGQASACRWDEITEVTQHTAMTSVAHAQVAFRQITLVAHDGRWWSFDALHDLLEDFPRLVETFHGETARRMLPRALDAWQAGATLDFGALRIAPDGLEYGDDRLPWHSIKVVGHDETVIDVFEHGARTPTWRVPAHEVVNCAVFIAMLAHTP